MGRKNILKERMRSKGGNQLPTLTKRIPLAEPLMVTFRAKDGTPVILRPAREEDANDLVTGIEEIVQAGKYLQKEEPRTVEQEREVIKNARVEGHMYMVIELRNKVVGAARIQREQIEMKKHTGKFRTWVAKEAQGKGIGNKIMKYTLEWARRNGLHKIWLTVFEDNAGAIHLYEKYGFVKEGTQKKQVIIDGQYDDEIFMAYFVEENLDPQQSETSRS